MQQYGQSSRWHYCKLLAHLDTPLKPEQKQALLKFVGGQDVFVSFPTGFDKSLCYILLPRIFDLLRGVENKSCVVIVVSKSSSINH